MDDLTFGQRLVAFRSKKQWLQRELAEKIGLSPTALNHYEKDNREPNLLTIKALAKALGVTTDELIGLIPTIPPIQAVTNDEVALLDDYRNLSDQGKEYIRQTMAIALNTYKKAISASNLELDAKSG